MRDEKPQWVRGAKSVHLTRSPCYNVHVMDPSSAATSGDVDTQVSQSGHVPSASLLGRIFARRFSGGDDYSLLPVPESFRRWPVSVLFGVLLAIPSALVFLAVGGSLELAFGTLALVVGLAVITLVVSIVGVILVMAASRSGLDSDLMSIVAGYGIKGSAVTSLIYAANFIVLFALENAIIVSALQTEFHWRSPWPLNLVIGAVLLLATWFGVRGLAPVMNVTLPVVGVILVWLVLKAGTSKVGFWGYQSNHHVAMWLAVVSVVAALSAFIVNATVASDVGRFLPHRSRRMGAWLFGVGLQVLSFFGATLIGAWLAVRLHGDANPGQYLTRILGGVGLLYIVVTQLRINSVNAYSGSLALANFGARAIQFRPGRRFWLVVMVGIGVLLALGNIYEHLVGVLTFESVFVVAWVMSVVGWLIAKKQWRGGMSPWFGVSEDHWWKVRGGITSLCIALFFSVPLAFGAAGTDGKALAPIVAGMTAFLSAVLLAMREKGVGVVVGSSTERSHGEGSRRR